MDIRNMSIKSLEAMKPALTTDMEKEFYSAIHTFLNDEHNPNHVYHYTDFVGLKGILLDKGFRLCRTDKMNDKKEMKNFIELVERSLRSRFIGNDFVLKKITETFRTERNTRKNDVAYIASFSAMEDDASQWERYGNNGRGVSIAFDVKILKNVAWNKRVMLQEVFYGRNANNHQITDALEDLFSEKDDVRHGFSKYRPENVYWQMWILSVLHKHFSFMGEREFRLMTFPTDKGKRSDGLGEICKEMMSTGLRECVYWDWKEECRQNNIAYEKLIKEIVVGPRAKMKPTDLKAWLKENNLECLTKCVRQSQSSLA